MAIVGTARFLCVGLNYRTAPVAVRERFAVPARRLVEVTQTLTALPEVEECVLLSTCNRTEIYFWASDPARAEEALLRCFLGEDSTGADCFYRYESAEALRHLAAVAAGLDSMVIGETEIFGQIKDAYRAAQQAGAVAARSHRIFQRVFTIGKKVRSSTGVTAGPTSVGAAAVLLAQRMLGDLAGVKVLVVGAGEVARTTAQSLVSRGAQSIFVANRSYERAVELAERVGGQVIRFCEWVPFLEQIDIVIVSTAAPVYVVSREVVEQAMLRRGGRPIFLIDLSVPRNVDPACGEVHHVVLYDIDTMQLMAEQTQQQRAEALHGGMRIVEDWVVEQGEELCCPEENRSANKLPQTLAEFTAEKNS